MSAEEYWLWIGDQNAGQYSSQQIMRLVTDETASRDTFFWSIRFEEWRPVSRMTDEGGKTFDVPLAEFHDGGISYVEYLLSGAGEDCAACTRLAGQRIAIHKCPPLPPEDLSCSPWNRCVVIAVS